MRKPLSIAVALALCALSNCALANPNLPSVVRGQAAFAQPDARTLQITNSAGTIINWQGFSIGAGELTRFIQPSAVSAVLNRVVGNDLSSILGQLSSNGRVFLVNPNGIVFGAGAVVNTAGLVASTLNIADSDFIAGRYRFAGDAGAGSILNYGVIRTSDNGRVFLIAPTIENHGVIDAPGGSVVLAAGFSATIASLDQPDIVFEVQAPQGDVVNLGRLSADGGAIGVFAGTLRHSGEMRADTIGRDQRGNIVLSATKDITLEAGSVISASGAPGGVNDGGSVRIVAEGTLDMRQGSTVRVDGGVDGGNGGFLELSGKERIALNGTFTGMAQKSGYRNGSLLIDPANIIIANEATSATVAVPTGFPMPGAVSPDGTKVYIGTPTGVSIIDTATNTVTGTISMAGNGYHIVFNTSGTRAYVVNNNSNSLTVVNTATNAILATIPTGAGPNHVVLSQDGAKAFVTNGNSNTVTVVNTVTLTGSNIAVGFGVSHSTVSPDGTRLYVNNGSSNTVSVLRVSDNATLATIAVGAAPQWNAVSPDGTRVYVANIFGSSVSVINTASNTVVATIAVGTQPQMVWVTPDGSKAYVINDVSNSVSVINTATNTVSATLALGASPAQYFGLSPDGSRAYIPLKGGTTVAVIDTVNAAIVNSVAVGTTPAFAAMAPSGNAVYISNRGGSGSVSVIETATATTTGGVIASGDSPGATLRIAPSSLSGPWTNVSLAATNDINVNAALASTDVPAGGALSLAAGHDLNVNAQIGSAGTRFNHSLNLGATNNLAINQPVFLGNNILVASGATINIAAAIDTGNGGVVLQASNASTLGANLSAGSGTVAVTGSGVMNFSGSPTLAAAGFSAVTLNVGGGTVTVNAPTATTNLNMAGGTLAGSGTLAVAGTLDSSGSSTIGMQLTNAGALQVAGGTLALTAPGGYLQIGGSTTLVAGTLNAASVTLAGGVLQGSGNINGSVANNAGTVRAGSSPGTLVINGNYTQGPAGVLEVELGGLSQGVSYDLLSITGTAALGGTLNVSMYGGFTGAVGNQFDVIHAGSGISGGFASVNVPVDHTFQSGVLGSNYRLEISGLTSPPPPAVSQPEALPQALVPASQIVQLQENQQQFVSDAAIAPVEPAEQREKRKGLPVCR